MPIYNKLKNFCVQMLLFSKSVGVMKAVCDEKYFTLQKKKHIISKKNLYEQIVLNNTNFSVN